MICGETNLKNKQKFQGLQSNCQRVADVLKAIAHPQRLVLVCSRSESEKTVTELLSYCEISQSQLSQFLGRLTRQGILASRKEGVHVYYSINDPKVKKIVNTLNTLYGQACTN